mgnify:CR=1 FL=1
MQGGALHSCRAIPEFLRLRAAKELGINPDAIVVESVIGLFRTCAEDVYSSTTQPCYTGRVDPKDLVGKIEADSDHTGIRLLTWGDVVSLPQVECHWYPDLAFRAALTTIP